MITAFIKIRKWTWLPIKFALTKRKLINEIELRSVKEVYERIQREEKNLLMAQRRPVQDPREIEKFNIILSTLKWLTLPKEG